MRRKRIPIKAQTKAFEDMLDKSIKELKKNSKELEAAIRKVLKDENIKVSEKDYAEVQALTKTLNEIDSVFDHLGE